ncbi:hypothetical protein [Streptococcus uberis]|uniref:hypothetical protein n=1 Tax=Streptococcus uberis TaxID=1349 RepID=UPI0038B4285C
MKKWFLILMLLGIFGCATQPSKVAAITGYDSDYYARYIDPDEYKITFAINVDGFSKVVIKKSLLEEFIMF